MIVLLLIVPMHLLLDISSVCILSVLNPDSLYISMFLQDLSIKKKKYLEQIKPSAGGSV